MPNLWMHKYNFSALYWYQSMGSKPWGLHKCCNYNLQEGDWETIYDSLQLPGKTGEILAVLLPAIHILAFLFSACLPLFLIFTLLFSYYLEIQKKWWWNTKGYKFSEERYYCIRISVRMAHCTIINSPSPVSEIPADLNIL